MEEGERGGNGEEEEMLKGCGISGYSTQRREEGRRAGGGVLVTRGVGGEDVRLRR